LELFIFGRFHARPGDESALEEALATSWARPVRKPEDEAAFDHHAGLPHTVRFIERVQALIDHPLDVTRARLVG